MNRKLKKAGNKKKPQSVCNIQEGRFLAYYEIIREWKQEKKNLKAKYIKR